MPSKKNRRGPHNLKSKKRKKSAGRNRRNQSQPLTETNEPFEQNAKRRIGQHSGTGESESISKPSAVNTIDSTKNPSANFHDT
jgi:hypothetical protein